MIDLGKSVVAVLPKRDPKITTAPLSLCHSCERALASVEVTFADGISFWVCGGCA